MLPAGKFPRIAALVAFLAAFTLLCDLLFVPVASRSVLVSNSLDFVVVFVASLCSFYVARRSSGFLSQVWLLLAIALGLETIAQGLTTYYQTFAPSALLNPIPSDILFFVWAAPVFMIFLPRSDEESPGIDSLRLLDFLQVAIVAVTAYLYFFYFTGRWKTEQLSLLSGILILYASRDLLLSIGFYFRYRSAPPPWFRRFCLILGLAFLAAFVSDLAFLFTLSTSVSASSWGDLLWMVPHLLVVYLAVTWENPEPIPAAAPPSRVDNFFASQFLPVALPLLVIFMARAIAREEFLLGWLALGASVLCSSIRLILTNRRQRKVADNLLATEQALRRSERMLSTAFRSSPDSFTINVFPDGPYLEANDGFSRLTGYSREETLGKTPSQMSLWADPVDRSRVLAPLTQTGEARDIEFLFRTKSGQIRSGLMSAALLDLDGTLCALVVVRDITARKEAENILRTNEERFRSLVENLHVGIVTSDPQARFLFANQTVLDLLGMPLDQVVGKNAIDLGLVALREDGTRIPDSLRPLPTAIAARQPIRNQSIGWRVPNRPEIVWTLLDAVPEFSSTGELVRVVVSFTNLTEQRRALEALRESEERFRTLVRDLHVAVALHRPDGCIEYVNPALLRMFELPDDAEVLQKWPSELGIVTLAEDGHELSPEERPVSIVLRTSAPVRDIVVGFRHPSSDKILWVFGSSVPHRDAAGNLVRVITSFADITEMKNAERAIHNLSTHLLQLQDEERRRIGRELHDGLAQTVLAINLSLAQARQSLEHEERAGRAIEKARSLTQQMAREIRTLSYLLHPPLLDDLGLVSALKEYAQGFSERSGIDAQVFVFSHFRRLPQPAETALFRIVQESLANIQRHSGSSIAKISLRQSDSAIVLEVVDFGRGMVLPPNGSSHSDEARYGVGIPGMRERIALVGGKLELHSGPQGTTVRATLPLSTLNLMEVDDAHPSHPDCG